MADDEEFVTPGIETNFSIVTIDFSDLRDDERVALEVIDGKTKHMGVFGTQSPLFQIDRPDKWKLVACKDELFSQHGFPTHETAIFKFLNSTLSEYDPDSDFVFVYFKVEEYNATAEEKLVLGVDYSEPKLTASIYIIEDKQYAIADAFSYITYLENRKLSEPTVDIVTFNGYRSHELVELSEQYEQERLNTLPRHIEASCDVGRFIIGGLAHDRLRLKRDTATNLYSFESANAPSLAFIYENDTVFFKELSTRIFDRHGGPVLTDVMFESIDATTVSISAMALELFWAATRSERQAMSAVQSRNVKYLLSVEHKAYKQRKISETETCEYVDMKQNTYLMYRKVLEEWLGRPADPLIITFAGE